MRVLWLQICWGLVVAVVFAGTIPLVPAGADTGGEDNPSVDCWGVQFNDSVTLGGSSVKPREKLSESDVEHDAFWTG